MRLQVTGIALAFLGWLCAVLSCALPMWRVTVFLNSDMYEAEFVSEGLWKVCDFLNGTQIQCTEYQLMMPEFLQVARVLMVTCLIMAALGLLSSMVGVKCTKWVEGETTKAKIITKAGMVLLTASAMVTFTVTWITVSIWYHNRNSLEDSGESQKMGTSLYIGWAASVLLLLGGALLCCPRLPCLIHQPHSDDYSAPTVRSSSSSGLGKTLSLFLSHFFSFSLSFFLFSLFSYLLAYLISYTLSYSLCYIFSYFLSFLLWRHYSLNSGPTT
jgi:claudin